MVIRLRKQSGMSLKEIADVAGVHHRTVEDWLARARKEGEGALQEKSRGRRMGSGRKLTMADECWLRDQIVGECPQQLKLPFALWTRPAIKALIRARFGEDATRKIFLVVDNLRVHHAKQVSEWLQDKSDRIELVFLPPYALESNPDEYRNRDFKTALRNEPVSQNAEELLEKAQAFMNRIAALPHHVAAYFKHPAAIYAVQGI